MVLFVLLTACAVIALAAGAYLAVALGILGALNVPMGLLALIGMGMWIIAWGAFIGMCLRLMRGQSAFTERNARTLKTIGQSMAIIAAAALLCALMAGRSGLYGLLEALVIPGIFAAASLAARILRGLLTHAMELEKEQEGVV